MTFDPAILLTFAVPADVGAALFVLFAAGVTAMTAVAFVLWAGWIAARGVLMIVTRLSLGGGRRVAKPLPERHHACPDPVCRTVNPAEARYCRHCGRMLATVRTIAS